MCACGAWGGDSGVSRYSVFTVLFVVICTCRWSTGAVICVDADIGGGEAADVPSL